MKSLRAKITSKGQVTLPKDLRDSLDIHEGDQVEFSIEASERIGIRKLPSAGLSAGALRHLSQEKPVSVDAMDAAVRQSMRNKYAEGSH